MWLAVGVALGVDLKELDKEAGWDRWVVREFMN